MTSQPPGETAASTTQQIGWAILIAVTLYICYFSHLGVIGFIGPDEPRYAWIARDMAETGDWVTPRLYGKPWFEKPPLLYWGGAIFFKLFGSSAPEVAARLPSAISAFLATLALAWLAWRTYGEESARWLLLLLPTSVGMIGFSHAAATDMPFAGMLTIAMVCAAAVLGLVQKIENTPILPRTPWLALILFGFFLGLAAIAKGPAAIILSAGAVFFWAILTKRWRDALRLLHPAATASFCLTALPWYILCAHRNPDFFRIFIVEHNFKRYLTPEFQHVQPFWFYIPIICLALFPWITGILALIREPLARLGRSFAKRTFELLALCWLLWPLLFFSVSKSKLPGYILPAVPPAMLLIMRVTSENGDGYRRRSIVARLFGATLVLLGVGFVALDLRIPSVQDVVPAPWHTPIFLSLILGGLISTVLAGKSRAEASLLCSIATVLFTLLGVYDSLHWIDPVYSPRAAVAAMQKFHPNFDPESAAAFQLPRGPHFGLNFYLRREIPDWSSTTDSARIVFTTYQGQRQMQKAGFECRGYIVFPAVIPCWSSSSLDRPGAGRQPRQEK